MSLNKYLYTFCVAFFGMYYIANSQNVGINTTTPREELEVGGSMRVSNLLDVNLVYSLRDPDVTTFLSRETDGQIKSFDLSNPTGVALGYFQEYEIVNPDGDWVLDFDTKISTLDYSMTITSANFNKELIVTFSSASDNFSLPYASIFEKNGTWHIIADFPSVHPRYTTPAAIWTITTLVFSNDLSKNLGIMEFDMGGSNTGSVTTPIID